MTRVLALWDSPTQADEPPFPAILANHVPDYPETIGLSVYVKLTGPTTRPALAFDGASEHAFAVECRSGVSVHRVMAWLRAMGLQE
jgi:hypothetical protein